ncbi:MAG: hypothetical protein ACXQT4_03640 [Methanotrichaceae archaeon]
MPTNLDIYRILQAYPRLKTICVHPAIFKKIPCGGQTILYMQNVNMVVDENVSEDISGRNSVSACNPEISLSEVHQSKPRIVTHEFVY